MFIDANVFIRAVDGSDSKCKASRRLLERIIKGEQRASTSMLVLNEVLYYFLEKDSKLAIRTFKRLVSLPNLEILPVSAESCNLVPSLVENGLQPTDAYHASVMLHSGIMTICSFDADFDRVGAIKRQEPK